MIHPRQAIRERVRDLLKFKTSAEDRVFTSREVPWRKIDLPGIAIYSLEETSEPAFSNTEPRIFERIVSLAVVGVVMVSEDVDDRIDALALEIESVVNADPALGLSTVVDSYLAATAVEIAEEQGRPVGAVRLTYTVKYQSDAVQMAA